MYKGQTVLATICARGGSKGVKNKNIRLLCGKPLIIYSLNLIKESQYIDDYIISTDSDDIIDIVERYGIEIEFKRPKELAEDKVSRIDVIQHAVDWVQNKRKKKFDIVADLGVATPLKNVNDLDSSIELLVDSNANNVFSVTLCSRNPYYNMVEVVNGEVKKIKNTGKLKDRRDAPKVYDMNDGLNIWKNEILFSHNHQFNENTKIYVMPRERSIDIDEEIDFLIAEAILNKKKI